MLQWCEVCDELVGEDFESGILACGHRMDNDGGFDSSDYRDDEYLEDITEFEEELKSDEDKEIDEFFDNGT